MGEFQLTWLPGGWTHVAVAHATVVGNIHRMRPEHPWIIRIEGFEFWHEPTTVITRWHYTPVVGVRGLREAKRLFQQIIATLPAIDLDR